MINLAFMGIFGIILFLMFMYERKERQRQEERRNKLRTESAKRAYIEATEKYKNKEAESLLKFEAGENVYFYHFIGHGRVMTDGDKKHLLTVLLTDKQLIILNRNDICSYKISEIGYIGLHINYILISVPGKDIYFDLNMRDIVLIEKIAGRLNIKFKKVDELINPTPDPDFDKDIDNFIPSDFDDFKLIQKSQLKKISDTQIAGKMKPKKLSNKFMKNPQGVIKRWTVFVGIFAVVVSIGAIVCLSQIGTSNWRVEELVPQFAIGLTLVSVMLWASVINSIKKNPKLAGTFAIIGGVLSLPIGVLLVIAGIRLRAAGHSLGEEKKDVVGGSAIHGRGPGINGENSS